MHQHTKLFLRSHHSNQFTFVWVNKRREKKHWNAKFQSTKQPWTKSNESRWAWKAKIPPWMRRKRLRWCGKKHEKRCNERRSETNMVVVKEHMAWIWLEVQFEIDWGLKEKLSTHHQLVAGSWHRRSLMSVARWHRGRRGLIRRVRWLRTSRKAEPQWCQHGDLRRKEKPWCWKRWKWIKFRADYAKISIPTHFYSDFHLWHVSNRTEKN